MQTFIFTFNLLQHRLSLARRGLQPQRDNRTGSWTHRTKRHLYTEWGL